MNLDKAKQEFLNYATTFDITHFQMKRKISHSFRVIDLCRQIANSLELSKEQVEIATLIGLLHDIARFEQFTTYGTFRDKVSFDHGDRAVEILQENNFIRKFIEDASYDSTIFSAVRNHNKFEIESGLSDEELIFAKLIRDADKIDILYQSNVLFWKTQPEAVEILENSIIEDRYMAPFYEKRAANREIDLKGASHELKSFLSMAGFVFDINFEGSYRILKEKNYINVLFDRFDFKNPETKEKVKIIRELINEQIEKY